MSADRPPSQPTTLCAAFQHTLAQVDRTAVALRTSGGGATISWGEYGDTVRRLAAGLASYGIRRGDTVALMTANRTEATLCDVAALHLGAAAFSIYATLAPDQITHVLDGARPRLVVCEPGFVPALTAAGADLADLVVLDSGAPGARTWSALLAAGDANTGFDFEAAWRAVGPGDLATLIYTSGTTGPSKGVELTHRQLLAQVDAVPTMWPMDATDSVISFLPTAHIADRLFGLYIPLSRGAEVTFLADMRAVADALRETRPTVFGAVPRVYEKLKAAVEVMLAAEADQARREQTGQAIRLGHRINAMRQRGERVSASDLEAHAEADTSVLAPIRRLLGLDRVRWAGCGAAPVAPQVLEFFLALGVEICEGWGMSEVAGMGFLTPPGGQRLGSVGRAVPGLEARLAPDGELQVRGPMVMRGYRGLPEQTREALSPDGWLSTGDIAEIDADGYVRIVDRKKELLINAAGKNMSPVAIELAVRSADPLIGPMVALADGRPYTTALITLDPDTARSLAPSLGLADATPDVLATDPRVLARVADAVAAGNKRLSRVEQIKRHVVLPYFWEAGGDELTPTAKIRRRNVSGKYTAWIDELYAAEATKPSQGQADA
ncbi:AMP-binding protein [Streptomyces mirabilis]|uniref:AMP-binding protein n=1 Tax=Streptomyces mirabilis TaxID=68239 RepID=UPI003657BEB2